MSKIKMLQDVVQDLRSLTDSLEALANVIEEPDGTQIDAARTEPVATAPEQTAEPVQPTEPVRTAAEPAPVADTPAPAAPKTPTLVGNCVPSWRPAPRHRRAPGFARCWPDMAWPS